MSSTDIQERLLKTSKRMNFQPASSNSGLRVFGALSWQLRAQGRNPLWPGHPSIKGRTRTHPHSLRWEPIHLTCVSLGYRRKPESSEKTHADIGRTCKLHTDSGPTGNRFFFFSINIKMNPAVLGLQEEHVAPNKVMLETAL